uniref:Reverse transcriptase domain-containing protein n=1 Tax=Xenopus tropicalis TaxID=8364 RepID=A0A803J318_XENTR
MDNQITQLEIAEAIMSMPAGKSPGPDGFGIEWYRLHIRQLVPKLLETFMYAHENFLLPPSFSEATIIVLPKPGKEPTLCASYRPISLLNTEIKILAKILARRLTKVITTLVHPDQSGFMPSKSTTINIRRLYFNLQINHENGGSGLVVSLDTAKAFDSSEWPYLWEILTRLGFGPSFVKWIRLLYSKPVARIKVNEVLSSLITLTRGTRQGCPLSPLLFSLAIEPMAILIRQNPEIQGLKYKGTEEKISLYADDTLLYLADPLKSLETTLNTISLFGKFSGLQINWDKSQILPLTARASQSINPAINLKTVDTFKYLGINIHKDPTNFISLNLQPLIQQMKNTLSRWSALPLTQIGRVNICKMIYLPKLLYVFTNSPCYIPKTTLRTIDRIQADFVWAKKAPTVARTTLHASTSQLGLAMPNLEFYYLAAQAVHASNWKTFDTENPASLLEALYFGSIESLHHALYRPSNCLPPLIPLLNPTKKTWDMLYKTSNIKNSISPDTPLWHNTLLKNFATFEKGATWARAGVKQLHHLLHSGSLKTCRQFQELPTLADRSVLSYMQIRHLFLTQFQQDTHPIEYTTVENIISAPDKRKTLSKTYAAITSHKYDPRPRVKLKWETSGLHLDPDDWEEVIDNLYFPLISTRDKLIQFKIIHQTYLTPKKLYQMGRLEHSRCLRCNEPDADYMHLLWNCPDIQRFWQQVMRFLADELSLPQVLNPITCLLGLVDSLLPKTASRSLMRALLFYAKKTVALHWMGPQPPTLNKWIKLINSQLELYRLTYLARGCPLKFEKIWNPWLESPATTV